MTERGGMNDDGHDDEPKRISRETLEKVAAGYNELWALQEKQRATTAEMLRACVHRLKSPDSRKRKEAIDGLEQLADMLETPRGRS
jgi:hypothetical protein